MSPADALHLVFVTLFVVGNTSVITVLNDLIIANFVQLKTLNDVWFAVGGYLGKMGDFCFHINFLDGSEDDFIADVGSTYWDKSKVVFIFVFNDLIDFPLRQR